MKNCEIVIEKRAIGWLIELTRDGVPYWTSLATTWDELLASLVQNVSAAQGVAPNPERIVEELRNIWAQNARPGEGEDFP